MRPPRLRGERQAADDGRPLALHAARDGAPRGWGGAKRPPRPPAPGPNPQRGLAEDQTAVMRALGFERFALCGHARGARVGYRLALAPPERVPRLAVLDIVPTAEV